LVSEGQCPRTCARTVRAGKPAGATVKN
jgi:hypothetical protein